MALGNMAKLGISAGVGSVATLATDALIQWYAPPKNEAGELNWYYQYSNWLGAGVGLAAAGVMYKVWGKEEALVTAVAAIGTALAVPAREYVVTARMEAEPELFRGLGGAKSRALLKAGAVAA